MSKQTVPLSQVFDHAVNELHASPCIKGYDTIVRIMTNVPQACIPLRIQIINKMKAYHNKFLPSLEMYYCLCFMDYAVKRNSNFRKQMVHIELVQWFECIAEFDRCKKKKQVKIVTDKAMRIVQSWGILFPQEFKVYTEMYMKYKKTGVQFHLPELTDLEYVHKDGNILENYVEKVSECILMIDDAMVNLKENVHRQSAEVLLKHANELKVHFKTLISNHKHLMSSEEQQVSQLDRLYVELTEKVTLLQALLNGEQPKEVFRTYTTGHVESEQVPLLLSSPKLTEEKAQKKDKKRSDSIDKESEPTLISFSSDNLFSKLRRRKSATIQEDPY
ncbi:hypothetical protein EHI8A_176360 [Entamoeba histolytica HM-1:IMSS-B]|uniref:VHS domain-containing protein n=6 Tax=Entamoeba histolytica TaxID=5759 RepID=C4MBC1_ENTH1|nr:hypothetical protein EHI_037540 [Entamoeba histolytica HM-1:IMSS]EMD43285.1 Hypothetical protein EHI5A_193160 [Entamoeba histolytica KU27]EMH78057.1 hypothetical protein EHI8A_176360 [Entamoeba histolytica HM-1:IMSS-B]EMS11451.1 hypothetical protein KM1_246420 [Entamoeba histolytica HM-3:IMSS]ENY62502.1 hypothetical protein EHI7A_153210 [Entamoeba histolytica HM-1:IMSS-A]BAN38428.1 hypothetical protein [Entamoeba histolytica]|eukprot:XP_648393.1 hypothetical protein EHI_037540 [Entamoeba histolytica HM-1:IMSS]